IIDDKATSLIDCDARSCRDWSSGSCVPNDLGHIDAHDDSLLWNTRTNNTIINEYWLPCEHSDQVREKNNRSAEKIETCKSNFLGHANETIGFHYLIVDRQRRHRINIGSRKM